MSIAPKLNAESVHNATSPASLSIKLTGLVGNVISKHAPRSSFQNKIFPPNLSWIIIFVIYNPIPVPCLLDFVVKKGVNIELIT